MKPYVIAFALLLLTALPAKAQVSAGVYGGATSDRQSTYMLMADFGNKVDVEPWVQSFGKDVQVGTDVIVIPRWIGVVGVNSNSFGGHFGVDLNVLGVQVRVMKHTDGATQGIAYYNINVTPRWYVQLWAAPATDVSAYLVGVGYNFRK